MLSLKVRRRSPIYRLGGKGVHGLSPTSAQAPGRLDIQASGRMSGGSRGAGCPGWRGWLFSSLDGRSQMSSRRGRMSVAPGGARCPGRSPDVRADAASFCALKSLVLDVRDLGRISGGGRMSGLDAGCPVAVVSSAEGWPCRSPGAGCPGSWPDVRCLEADLAFFRWFSSSVDLVA